MFLVAYYGFGLILSGYHYIYHNPVYSSNSEFLFKHLILSPLIWPISASWSLFQFVKNQIKIR